jgi:methyl coenzyme M reductase subunit D
MTGDEKLLSDCEEMKAVTVTVVNGDRLTAVSIGPATLSTVQGTLTCSIPVCLGIWTNVISL